VSHNKERKEKICLNCKAAVYGRYCHVCGQENIEPKESFWHLVNHFVEDITHFDSKFFNTIKYLLFRPGFLSKEYLSGRRMSYLHPIRMYVFTSAVFFLIYFSIHSDHKNKKVNKDIAAATDVIKNDTVRKFSKDTAQLHKYKYTNTDTALSPHIKIGKLESSDIVDFSIDDTDTAVNTKNGVVKRSLGKFYENREEIRHKVPQVMFCTLPLMALVLMMLYRKQKQFFYVSHLIFIIHLFNAIYIMYMLQYGFEFLSEHFLKWIFEFLSGIVSLLSFFYVYKALRNFYGQRRLKTFVKCCLLYCFFGIIFLIVYALVISPTLYYN